MSGALDGADLRGFQPTYKELKRSSNYISRRCNDCFQPTYKELKHGTAVAVRIELDCFQPTYKELKPGYNSITSQ